MKSVAIAQQSRDQGLCRLVILRHCGCYPQLGTRLHAVQERLRLSNAQLPLAALVLFSSCPDSAPAGGLSKGLSQQGALQGIAQDAASGACRCPSLLDLLRVTVKRRRSSKTLTSW